MPQHPNQHNDDSQTLMDFAHKGKTLQELIAELCPDGVEWLRLGEVARYSTERIDCNKITVNNYVSVENLLPNKQGKTIALSVPKVGNLIRFYPGDVLIGNIRPYLQKIWLADQDGGTNGDVSVVQISNDSLTSEFLYYCLSSNSFFNHQMQYAKGAKMPRGDKHATLNYPIPIPPLPPLPTQARIVAVLDNFDAVCNDLQIGLPAEINARKKQYEYYRDLLLNFAPKE